MASDAGKGQMFLSKLLKSVNMEGFVGWAPSTLSQLLVDEQLVSAEVAARVGEEIGREIEKRDPGSLSPDRIVDILNAMMVKHGIEERIPLSKNALIVLKKRYLKRDADGNPEETPRDLFLRVARVVAQAERHQRTEVEVEIWASKFFRLMSTLRFLPNSPTLMNAGRELGQLSACFVLPVEDSLDSIFEAVKHTALIHKSGGGTGFSFSRLRPQNDMVQTTRGVSSGPVSFMRVFDAATETIKQGGTRRGANMGVLSVEHPDIVEFVRCKEAERSLNNFNISVGVTERFMAAVERNETYELLNPRSGTVVRKMPAVDVFRQIVKNAHRNGEPGIVFLDRMNASNPTPAAGRIEATNPCGEQPLLPYESCNLGSINLAAHVSDGKVDWAVLGETVRTATRFLDDVIDVNRYPLAQIREMTLANRKIGLGVMGFADMLILTGVQYDSDRALKVADEVMKFIDGESKAESARLAEERGAFKRFAASAHSATGKPLLRNATTTTVAPTGTISIIAGCSSGIEPLFAVSFIRHVLDRDDLVEVHPIFERIARERGFYSEELMREIAGSGSVRKVDAVPEEVRQLFPTALDIKPEWHVRMQAAFQAHTDNAVSKTVNFPNDATEEDVANVFKLACKLGCKGITVYRDRSRAEQVLNIKGAEQREKEKESEDASERGLNLQPRERPDVVVGSTQKLVTGCGNIYVTINEDDNGPFELFTAMGKAGGCPSSQAEAISRLISLALRAGIDINEIIKQLQGVRCPSPVWKGGEMILSCADAIAKAMKRYEASKQREAQAKPARSVPADQRSAQRPVRQQSAAERVQPACPECGGPVQYQEGCAICYSCTYWKCGS